MESPKKNPQRVRARYSKEFKLEAVKLLPLGQKPATELALELGIRRNQLYKRQMTGSGATHLYHPGRSRVREC